VIQEFYRLFAFCEVLFAFLFLTVDFLQKIDNFIEANATKAAVLLYFLYKAPFIMVNMVPPAVLISVHYPLHIDEENELTALRTSTQSLHASKTMMLGVPVHCGDVSSFETVVPYTSSKGNRIWNVDVQKQIPGSSTERKSGTGAATDLLDQAVQSQRKTMGNPSSIFRQCISCSEEG
jgi:lipopolysaccharide export system permease protein